MNQLETILHHKRQEIGERKGKFPLERLREMPMFGRQTLSLRDRLAGKRIAIIAEIKKASPSKGIIRDAFEPGTIAIEYVSGGASALSVLTDSQFFQGSLADMATVRGRVAVPLLRKDFILDSYQLTEAKAQGADAVLLIAAALEPGHLLELQDEAATLGLECLVEVHSEKEATALDQAKCRLIGINNRDLATFSTDLSVSLRLRRVIDAHVVVVSESGIATAEDLRQLIAGNIHAALIGEAFMRQEHPGRALSDLLTEVGGTGQ
jgi:indole-3-glycerol phosphate synthase